MPKRTDIKAILVLGAGPIVIGQACEFDYSGTQACRALRQEGYRVVLVNSNPATIMTDPNVADATYIEPLHWQVIEKIIAHEHPDALLPTMGGQTALNTALDLAREGVLARHGVQMIGATKTAIDKAEDRYQFGQAMKRIGLEVPRSAIAHSMKDALKIVADLGFPAVIRPSFTMGGSGGGIAYNREEFIAICERGLDLSPTQELLIDEAILGWKEYELEVVRDSQDNCIIVCAIENVDPMGIHTGDSITVAPALTLTDKAYQRMRNAAIAILREIGVNTGGANVQFAVNPKDGRMVVIEMNPRVSRSSALASKATGFPIAKVAAKLAVGYTLDELKNDMTDGDIPAAFEPTLDYVVTKVPRFNFEKFPTTDARLTTQMKSVGEVMAIGSTFVESLQKALRGLELGVDGLDPMFDSENPKGLSHLKSKLQIPSWDRIWYVADAFRAGMSCKEVQDLTRIDPWFLNQIAKLVDVESQVQKRSLEALTKDEIRTLKQQGFSDRRLAKLLGVGETHFRKHRDKQGVHPVYKRIDTCAGEFATETAFLYSTYASVCEAVPTSRKKVIVLGGGPNRIGQGIEFDYCCVHAAMAMQEMGYETIMVNCNPETVSTDYDISDRLYFEPLTLEDILAIVRVEKPDGLIVQYGGQTPLKLARALEQSGVPILGTSPDSIDRAEDRERFQKLIKKLDLSQPPNGAIRSAEEGMQLAKVVPYPILVRPSYVLGGRAMVIVHNEEELCRYMAQSPHLSLDSPLLLDHFLDHATEVDVDAVCDGKEVMIGGIMEHIEQAGIHSGDSACSLPAHSLSRATQQKLCTIMHDMALELGVVGLVNAQFAIQDHKIYVLEVNPRASRTVPFVAKATGVPLAKIAVRCAVGISLKAQGYSELSCPPLSQTYAVKLPVFPFEKFPGVDPILGPEMKSTGEVMGMGSSFELAFAKAMVAAGQLIPKRGLAFLSVKNADKAGLVPIAHALIALGFSIVATGGTASSLQRAGVLCDFVNKVTQGRPHIVDMIKNDEIDFVINTTEGEQAIADSFLIRRSALQHKVAYTTTLEGGGAICAALAHEVHTQVTRLQDSYVNRTYAKSD